VNWIEAHQATLRKMLGAALLELDEKAAIVAALKEIKRLTEALQTARVQALDDAIRVVDGKKLKGPEYLFNESDESYQDAIHDALKALAALRTAGEGQ
jgi:hypothetical protein